jgi:hypothetical protein
MLHSHFLLINSTPKPSTDKSSTKESKDSKDSKDKETGFFKRLFKHEKDTDEAANKATGTP